MKSAFASDEAKAEPVQPVPLSISRLVHRNKAFVDTFLAMRREAISFTAAEEESVALNHLDAKAFQTGMELLEPVCRFTPNHKASPVTLTTTYTPRGKY